MAQSRIEYRCMECLAESAEPGIRNGKRYSLEELFALLISVAVIIYTIIELWRHYGTK